MSADPVRHTVRSAPLRQSPVSILEPQAAFGLCSKHMSGPGCVPSASVPPELARYSRQIVLPGIGVEGQRRLASSRVLVAGTGALGASSASLMVRAGAGFVRLVDRDFIELDNLQRQSLYDEADIAAGLPKAVAAARKLAAANSAVRLEAVVTDIRPHNVERLVKDCDLVLDGSDNFELRLLLNDACLRHRVPWIYGAVIGSAGCSFTILPGGGPCFRCLLPDLPAPGSAATCETAGVLGAVAQAVAAMQAAEGIKILTGHRGDLVRRIRFVDLWDGTFDQMEIDKGSRPCPACELGRYEYLDAARKPGATTMCGRTTVQVDPGPVLPPDFAALAGRLGAIGTVKFSEHLLRFVSEGIEIALFPDGRAMVKGARDEASARACYARFIGS